MYYNELTGIPVPSSAQFLNRAANVIQITSTLHDHVRNIKRNITKSIDVNDLSSPQIWQEIGDMIGFCLSPSGTRRAVLREVKAQTDTKRYIEIWRDTQIEASADVTDAHGGFYTDEHLSSLAFSPSETSLIYTAEANIPKDTGDPYHRFRFTPHFGEGIAGKKRPTLFIYSWNPIDSTRKLTTLSVSSPALFGQAIFSPDGNSIYATGYEYTSDGRLLGVKGCLNRPTGIWQLSVTSVDLTSGDLLQTLSSAATKLTPSYLSCRSPRILSHNGTSTLFWLACHTGGAHASTSMLYSHNIDTNASPNSIGSPLVDLVFDPLDGAFPGLYPDFNLPLFPFVQPASLSSPGLITHSTWRSRSTVLLISTNDGTVTDLTPEDGNLYSWRVHGTDGQARVICSRSSPVTVHKFVMGKFNETGEIEWRVIEKPVVPEAVQHALSGLRASIIQIPGRSPTETIVIQEKTPTSRVPPCVTAPHGGPHATTMTTFSPATVALALEGYTISLPNHTGSLGFGETSVRALLGNCGTLDVGDCIATTRHLVSLGISEDGPGRQFVSGGSHGGFLSAHLIGQFPDVYTAAVMRNPVISGGEMSSTDIPDWYYAEFGLPYPLTSSVSATESPASKSPASPQIMTPETFTRIHNASPIVHVGAVRASVLLLVGKSDLRVAPTQGIEYYHALKGQRGVQKGLEDSVVELLVFEGESHPLEGVEASRVGYEAGRDFFAARRK
ncbi:Alpha/Beta hydrolase protein [Collybia nuda]|uniref:acylaminoacyl-peptidase n=1 Tax=Collybia nuda TaxID=64659 RepID=A0A9P5Y340_9AGAR|nr:Alpha/Beta hydrolase protein [Collybia nuda]